MVHPCHFSIRVKSGLLILQMQCENHPIPNPSYLQFIKSSKQPKLGGTPAKKKHVPPSCDRCSSSRHVPDCKLSKEQILNWFYQIDIFFSTIYMEEFEPVVAKPEGVHCLLVFSPSEGLVAPRCFGCDHLWKWGDPCMEGRCTKEDYGQSWAAGVGHGPMSHTNKSSICQDLQLDMHTKIRRSQH